MKLDEFIKSLEAFKTIGIKNIEFATDIEANRIYDECRISNDELSQTIVILPNTHGEQL